MDLKATAEESNTQSAFGFLQNNVSAVESDSSTLFSFIQEAQTIAPDNAATSSDLHEKSSSFSFLGQGDVSSSTTNSNYDNQTLDKVSGDHPARS